MLRQFCWVGKRDCAPSWGHATGAVPNSCGYEARFWSIFILPAPLAPSASRLSKPNGACYWPLSAASIFARKRSGSTGLQKKPNAPATNAFVSTAGSSVLVRMMTRVLGET